MVRSLRAPEASDGGGTEESYEFFGVHGGAGTGCGGLSDGQGDAVRNAVRQS